MLAESIIALTQDFNPTLLGRCDNGGADIHYPLETDIDKLAKRCGFKPSCFHSTIWGYFLRVPGIVNSGHSKQVLAQRLHVGDFLVLPNVPVSRISRISADQYGIAVVTNAGQVVVYHPFDKVEVLE